MKLTISKMLASTLISVGLASLPIGCYADAAGDVYLQSINKAVNYLAKYLNPTLKYWQQQNYQVSPDAGEIIASNTGKLNAQQLVDQAVQQQLVASSKNILDNTKFINGLKTYMASIPNADFPAPTLGSATSSDNANDSIKISGYTTPNSNTETSNVSLDSLIGPTFYNFPNADKTNVLGSLTTGANGFPAKWNTPLNYLMYLTNMADPFPTINYSKDFQVTDSNRAQIETLAKDPGQDQLWASYLLGLRSYAALKSVALNNLFHMYYERVPIKNLGTKAGIPAAQNPIAPNASKMQVAQYMATRRLNPAWYQKMAKAPPATIEREMLYLLAEMNYQQYQQRLATERLNATMSALLLSVNYAAEGNTTSLQERKANLITQFNPNYGTNPDTTSHTTTAQEAAESGITTNQ